MLCLGKSDFETITGFREDAFLQSALGLERVPPEGILRRRMDACADAYCAVIVEASLEFLPNLRAPVTPLANGLVALDADTTLLLERALPRARVLNDHDLRLRLDSSYDAIERVAMISAHNSALRRAGGDALRGLARSQESRRQH